MAIIRFKDRPMFRHPWADFERMRREMDILARELTGEAGGYAGPTVYPPLNISEDSDALYVRAEIPGVGIADLHISLEGETLTIKGERPLCEGDQSVSYHRREIDCGSFSRAISLPCRIDVAKVAATSKNGILTITLPRRRK